MTRLLFAGQTDDHGIELWVSDGTTDGTALLMDINPGARDSRPGEFTLLGDGRAVFAASSDTHGRELWVSDGTARGTFLVKDINPGGASSDPFDLTAMDDGRVLFQANDGTHGYELWVTDGTEAGTVMVRDINPGAAHGGPSNFTPLGDGRVVFTAIDEPHGRELWVTDGTEAGTTLLKDIFPGPEEGMIFRFTQTTDGRVIFAAEDDTHGFEPWITDGTPDGTFLLRDIWPGSWSSPNNFLPLADGRTLFLASDAEHGRELWITDGTTDGTTLVKDINPGPNGIVTLFTLGEFGMLPDGRVLLPAVDGTRGSELWVTDGTEAGTALVKDINPGPGSSNPVFTFRNTIEGQVGGRVLFSADDGTHGRELWITDGTEAGTRLLKDINEGGADSFPNSFVTLAGERVVFSADDGIHGRELWVSDGTEAGTRLLLDTRPGAQSGSPRELTLLSDGRAVFTAAAPEGTTQVALWVTDGTEAGSYLLQADGFVGIGAGFHLIELGDVAPGDSEFSLSGRIADPSGTPLASVAVSFAGGQVTHASATSDAAGAFVLEAPAGAAGRLEFARDWQPDDAQISANDALEVLRLAVGLQPSWGPASAHHYIAADIDRDGMVTANDALEVLRTAVGLETGNRPEWVFLDTGADLSGIGQGSVDYETGIAVAALGGDMDFGVTAILLGSMQEHA